STRDKAIAYSLSITKTHYVGYIASFSDWFSRNWDIWVPPEFGINSFHGPAGWLGYGVGAPRFDEVEILPGSDTTLTNVYSMFRHMALDWTLPGSAVFLFLMSL